MIGIVVLRFFGNMERKIFIKLENGTMVIWYYGK